MVLIQRLPYDSLAKRTITLEADKLVMEYRNIVRSFTDDYLYAHLSPDIKTVRRGASEWSGVIYGFVVTFMVFFLFTKMSHSLLFRVIFLGLQVAALAGVVWLLLLWVIKRDYYYILDRSGDCILCLKATPKAREFVKKLREKIAAAGEGQPVQ